MRDPGSPQVAEIPPLSKGDFAKIRALVYERAGIDLRNGKETLVSARLGKQLRKSGCRSYADFIASVESDRTGEGLTALIDALTTNYTYFFREPDHFQFLRDTVLPQLAPGAGFDVWCAAAATGEEPYTLAMLILEASGSRLSAPCVLATDISTRALAAARAGVYASERFKDVPAALLHKYWLRGEGPSAGLYKVKPELARAVEFVQLNLVGPFTLHSAFPVIFCRNVLIYFDKSTQERVMEQLCRYLQPGGYLFLGHSESLAGTRHELEHAAPAVYRRAPSIGRRS